MAQISIPKPEDFSFSECLWFLNRNYDDCLHVVGDNRVSRAITVGNKVIVLTVTENKDQLLIDYGDQFVSPEDIALITGYVREWFDLDRNIGPYYQALAAHPVLGYMAGEFYGLRVMNIPDVFEALVWSIIGQQINLTFAFKLKRAMVEKYGMAIDTGTQILHAFPGPEILAELSVDELREMQFSRQKAAYIINAAVAFRDGLLSKKALWDLATEDKIAALTALKGIGRWTANYVVMKSLNDTTGVPHGDVGLLKALEDHKLISSRKDTTAVDEVFRYFAGWESYLVHYLWRSLAIPTPPANL
jgi:DNA-3-methyladenine glycosylase II